jgi:hypothetical protein
MRYLYWVVDKTDRQATYHSLYQATRTLYFKYCTLFVSYNASCKMGINRVVQFQFKSDIGSDAIDKVSVPIPHLARRDC